MAQCFKIWNDKNEEYWTCLEGKDIMHNNVFCAVLWKMSDAEKIEDRLKRMLCAPLFVLW